MTTNYEKIKQEINKSLKIQPLRGFAKTHPFIKIVQELSGIENLEQWLQQEAE